MDVASGVKVVSLTDAKAPTKHGGHWAGVEVPRWASDRAVGWYSTGRGIVCRLGDDDDGASVNGSSSGASLVQEFTLPAAPIEAFRLHPTLPQAGNTSNLSLLDA